MKMKQIAGLCVLIPVLLSGCGNQSTSQPAAASTAQPQASTQAAASASAKPNNADRPAMNQAQRGLFMTFQTLVMMDKAEGLAITKEQATAMLPVAQDIVSKSELSDENKTKLLEKLTDAQNKYVEEAATRMANRGGNGGGGNGNAAAGGGRRDTKPEASPSASPGAAGSAATGTDAATGGTGTGGTGGKRPAGGQGGPGGGQMRDPGAQLVELLQERVK